MPFTPVEMTPLPTPPDPSNRATFNTLAYPWTLALGDFTTEANDLALNAFQNAFDAEQSALDAGVSATTALNAPGTSAVSTTSLTIGTGTKVPNVDVGKFFAVGQFVIIANTTTPSNYMIGQVVSYFLGDLTVNVTVTSGSGTFTDWTVSLTSKPAQTANTIVNTPSGGIAATDVQTAINELDTEKFAKTGGQISGNLELTGTGRRILADMSNATFTSRLAFQTSTANSNTNLGIIPNGTAFVSQFQAYNNSNPTNSGIAVMRMTDTEMGLFSGISGTGTYRPMNFYTNNTLQLSIATNGLTTFSGNVVLNGTGAEGGQVEFRNPDNTTTGMTVDVSSIDTGRIFSVRNNYALQIGQLGGTGGSVGFYTGGAERLVVGSDGTVISKNSGGLGYGAGSGGSVTQVTSKTTGVTLNKPSGRITMTSDALAAGATASFTVFNSLMNQNDLVQLNVVTVGYKYTANITYSENGRFDIALTNVSGGSLAEAVQIKFNIFKGSSV